MIRLSKLTWLAIVLSFALTCSAADTKKGRLSGNVRTVNGDKTEVTLRKGTADRIVIIGSQTRFKVQSRASTKSTASSIDDVTENRYMTCTGTWDGAKLAATSCTISPTKQR
jgi:uncharacterized protein (DUF2147 family)